MTYDLAISLAGRLVAGKLIVANMAKHYCPALYYLMHSIPPQLLVNQKRLRATKLSGS